MVKIVREDLIKVLDFLQPGLLEATKDRPGFYCFSIGKVFSWNDNVACEVAFRNGGANFKVPADPLRTLLGKLSDQEISFCVEENQLRIRGINKRAKINLLELENEVIPRKSVKTKWEELPEGFEEALKVVMPSAARKQEGIERYIHFHPGWVEACDNFQAVRCDLVGWDDSILIHAAWAKHLVGAGLTRFVIEQGWIHFKSSVGRISLRRYDDDYPDYYSAAFAGDGRVMKMPKGLEGIINRAVVMSKDEKVGEELGDDVEISFRDGRVTVRSKGKYGSYQEFVNEDYNSYVEDENVSFIVSASMFKRMLDMPGKCEVTDRTLRKITGSCSFAVRLNSN